MTCGMLNHGKSPINLQNMKTDPKTAQQQKAYFLYHEWIAEEMNNQNIPLASLVIEVQPKATKTTLHELFKHILYSMYQKTSTSDITREEMSNCLDVYNEALAKIGVHIEFPEESKRSLLQFYS
jgi:hypothetical protein